jgi:hypothetical protein
MTTATPRETYYNLTGVRLDFPVPFPYLDPSHVFFNLVNLDGSYTPLTGWSFSSPGVISFPVGQGPVGSAVVLRQTPEEPLVRFAAGTLSASKLNQAITQLAYLVQEQDLVVNSLGARTALVPEGETVALLPVAALRTGGKVLGFDGATGELEMLGGEAFRGAPGADASSVGLFTSLPGQSIATAIARVRTTGYTARGIGAADYIYDAVVNTAYVTANPTISFKSADGRGWRLATDPSINLRSTGAKGDNATNDSAAILAAIVAARGQAISTLRTPAGEVELPPGDYRIYGALELAPANGCSGLTVSGSGSGAVNIILADASATISMQRSRAITWRDINFRSLDPTYDGALATYGVDLNQVCFTISHDTGNPLKQWRFERCEFAGFYTCFKTLGSAMCDGFNFSECQFSQCYFVVDNYNDQAVNWNFVNCTAENDAIVTTKDKNLAAVCRVNKGMSMFWSGGGIIGHGYLVYFNMDTQTVVQRPSHYWHFLAERIELVDLGDGSHAPLIGHRASGFQTPGNTCEVLIDGVKVLNRAGVPASTVLFRLWDNLTLTLRRCSFTGGKVVGEYTANSGTQYGRLHDLWNTGLTYEEVAPTAPFDHYSHWLTIRSDDPTKPDQDIRPYGGAAAPVKEWAYWGNTGSMPTAPADTPLPRFLKHTLLESIFIHGGANLSQNLTGTLMKADESASYGAVTVNTGSKSGETFLGLEVGFQIPELTDLKIKWTGTAAIQKGRVGVKYR